MPTLAMNPLRITTLAMIIAATCGEAIAQSSSEVFYEGFEPLDSTNRLEGTFDLDGDGDLDAVGWWWHQCGALQSHCGTITVRTYENAGDGTLAIAPGEVQIDLPWGATEDGPATWVGDVDGDETTCEMIITYGSFFHLVRVWFRPGSGPIQRTEHVQVLQTDPACNSNWIDNERAIAVGDYDLDGRLDVAITNGTQLYLLHQRADGSFVEGEATQLLPSMMCSLNTGQSWVRMDLETADFTGNGRLDLAAVRQRRSPWGNQPWWPAELIVTPVVGGQFFPPTVTPLLVGGAAHLTLGDVDGDGDLDGVVFGQYGYQIWRRTAAGTMVLEPLQSGGPATDLADVDGDGDLDGICCGGGGGHTPTYLRNTTPSAFEVCLNDGTGQFDDAVAFASVGGHHVAGAVDLDGDGDVDLLGGRTVLLNHLHVGTPFCMSTQNSSGWTGRIHVAGHASLGLNDLELRAYSLPPSTFGLFFLGGEERASAASMGAGQMCLGGALHRLPVISASTAGVAVQPLDLHDTAHVGAVPLPGDVLRFQFWYRDGANGSNTTAGRRLVIAR